MRSIIDAFSNLHIVLRIGIIAVFVTAIAAGALLLFGPDDSAPEGDAPVVADGASGPNDTEVTDGGEAQVAPEDGTQDEAVIEDPAEDVPADVAADEAANAEAPVESPEDPAATEEPADAPEDSALPEEETEPADPATDESTEDPADMPEEPVEDAEAADTSEADAIKASLDPIQQELWDEKNWIPVTLVDVYDTNAITVEFLPGNTDALNTFGGTIADISLLSVEVPAGMEEKATARTMEFLTDADTLVIEREPGAQAGDNKVFLHADFVNLQEVLLEEGLAVITDADGETTYMDSFRAYEQDAKDAELGIWAEAETE